MTGAKRDTAHLVATLGLLVTTVVSLISGVWKLSNMDKRIDLNTQDIGHVKQLRVEDSTRLEKRLDTMDKKLDRLLENKGG